jgi:glycosyltransferase involved in cell wall biosynthesis
MPKVTVIIPTCNRPQFIGRAIKSVLNQTYQDYEIIIIDDGLKVRAEKEISTFNDRRIRYIQHQENKGGAAARNTGIKNSKGLYVAFLDDDDEWMPEKLKKQVEAFENSDDSVVLAFCGFEMRDENGKFLEARLPNQSGIIWPFNQVLHRSYIWTTTIMVRKKVALSGVLFDENLKKNQEWDFQLRLLKVGKFFAINEPLAVLNILGENEHMGGMGNINNITSAYELFIKKHYTDYQKNKKSLAYNYGRLSLLYRESRQYKKARVTLFNAWLADPANLSYFIYMFKATVLMWREILRKNKNRNL